MSEQYATQSPIDVFLARHLLNVVRPYAMSPTAEMIMMKSIRPDYGSVLKRIGNNVGVFRSAVDGEPSIAVSLNFRCPYPAFGQFVSH